MKFSRKLLKESIDKEKLLNTKIRLAGECPNSLVNGLGLRKVIYFQGCPHACNGCFNPTTHDPKGGDEKTIGWVIEEINRDELIRGVTLSGGDPFFQPEALCKLVLAIRVYCKEDLDIWVYTGFEYGQLIETNSFIPLSNNSDLYDILDNIEYLVDGKYDKDKKDLTKIPRGSTNQKIIDMRRTVKNHYTPREIDYNQFLEN